MSAPGSTTCPQGTAPATPSVRFGAFSETHSSPAPQSGADGGASRVGEKVTVRCAPPARVAPLL